MLINTTSNTPFNSLATIVHTGDNKTFTDIYHAISVPGNNDINLQKIPDDYFNFAPYGVNSNVFATYPLTFDSFYVVWRIEIPLNKTAFNQYIDMNNAQTVFYLKYKNAAYRWRPEHHGSAYS